VENVILITKALVFIEENLTNDIKTDDIAKELYCSKSLIEKLFRYVTNMSIRDYLIRRRMSKAAKDMVSFPDVSLLDIALKYGYSSNEAFTRAFKHIWHVSPSEYRNSPARYELFPALNLEPELMEDESMKQKKKVDISELYDLLKERKKCYFVGVDIKGLISFNEISREAGDIAILTALQRLETASGDDDIVFRIGSDEFVSLTNSEDKAYAEKIVQEVLSHNGETIKYKEKDIPLSVYVTSYQVISDNLKYADLFSQMQSELDRIKFE
jgi:AraC family transcriptional regulator